MRRAGKGDQMQLVKAALALLEGSSRAAIGAYRKEVDAWFDLTREAFKLDCVALQALWSAMCEGVDWEEGSTVGHERAKQTADQIRASREAPGRQLLELYEELRQRGEQLRSDPQVGVHPDKLLDQMRKRRFGAVEKMINHGAVRGYQHPLTQFAQRYGVERHLDMMTSSTYGCDIADQPIEGTGSGEDPGKPDCINADRCRIYEFKPNSPSGQSAYAEQMPRYHEGVNKFFSKHLAAGTVPSIAGGQQFMDKLKKNRSCWDASTKKTKFEIEPKYYNVCEKKYECVQP
jgi:hypothetical protein